jgi:Chalcone isomerase-like
MRTLPAALLTLLLAVPAAMPAAAGTLEGVTLPDKVEAEGHSLALNGMGLRKKLFIKVYVGGLYLQQKGKADGKQLLAADRPFRMALHFLYNVSKEQMCDAWSEGLEANTANASAQVKKDFQTLCGWMDGVGKGQKLFMTYTPGLGTQVEVGGKTKGTLPGKATADAILATWVGSEPAPGADFKKAVLGG